MSAIIDHGLLDHYTSAQGELERLPPGHGIDPAAWDLVDALLLDLHLIHHGYAEDGYAKHVERRLRSLCADDAVAARMKAIQL